MPKSGLKHIDVGPELTKTEWESEESHELLHGNSFPSSPVERQLFYRDDEHKWYIYNGTGWGWLGGGSGGGMSVHGNEYHDPDFATEATLASHATAATGIHGVGASTIESTSGSQSKVDTHAGLTTGIHGVGSSYIALAPAASHLVRTFTKGWTSGKVLKGAGVNADPTEETYFIPSLRCKVYRAISAQSIPTGTDTKIQYNAEVYDYYNEFDSTTNYRFTASEPGVYLIEGNLQLELSVDGCEYGIKAFKNGTEEASRVATLGKACYGMLGTACVVLLNTNDYIEMKTRHDAGSSKNLTADLSRNYISITRIAPLS